MSDRKLIYAVLAGEIHLTSVLGPLVRCAMKDGARGFRVISGLRKKLEFSIVEKPQLVPFRISSGKVPSPLIPTGAAAYLI